MAGNFPAKTITRAFTDCDIQQTLRVCLADKDMPQPCKVWALKGASHHCSTNRGHEVDLVTATRWSKRMGDAPVRP